MRKAIRHLRSSDPVLAALIQRVGPYALQSREPSFETLVRSIVNQQISGKVASVLLERLTSALPGREMTPSTVLKLTPEQMRGFGLSSAKTAYIRDLAERTQSGEVVFEDIHNSSDEEVIEHLTRVKGIGVWTAHMFLIFALQRPDVLPIGDLGVRTAIRKAYDLETLPTPKEVAEIAIPWHPFCSIATWYLWRSLDGPAQL